MQTVNTKRINLHDICEARRRRRFRKRRLGIGKVAGNSAKITIKRGKGKDGKINEIKVVISLLKVGVIFFEGESFSRSRTFSFRLIP
jgi:hypothetical protein